MRVLLVHNRSSGRGARGMILDALRERLAGAGHGVDDVEVGPGAAACDFAVRARGCGAMIIAGGDGTIHHMLGVAAAAGIPLYHYPLGTENLFAREFGMDRSAERAVAALKAGRIRVVDLATANGVTFALMASVGFDACVVERVAASRRGGIRRSDYVRHIVREMWKPRIMPLTVEVDGSRFVADAPGMVVVANSRQYAARLNPARAADMSDGLLDVVFMPYTGRAGVVWWMGAAALGMHGRLRGLRQARGRAVRIAVGGEKAMPYQLDGECAGAIGGTGSAGSGPMALEIVIRPSALKVLLP